MDNRNGLTAIRVIRLNIFTLKKGSGYNCVFLRFLYLFCCSFKSFFPLASFVSIHFLIVLDTFAPSLSCFLSIFTHVLFASNVFLFLCSCTCWQFVYVCSLSLALICFFCAICSLLDSLAPSNMFLLCCQSCFNWITCHFDSPEKATLADKKKSKTNEKRFVIWFLFRLRQMC